MIWFTKKNYILKFSPLKTIEPPKQVDAILFPLPKFLISILILNKKIMIKNFELLKLSTCNKCDPNISFLRKFYQPKFNPSKI